MSVGRALQLCPNLVTVPYMFSKYAEVSDSIYRIFFKYTHQVQPVSCDEAYLEFVAEVDGVELANRLRAEIFGATGCRSSAGVGNSMLLARLAAKKAKPDGCFQVSADRASAFVKPLPVSELPGVGYKVHRRLEALGLHCCGDICAAPKQLLQKEFGPKIGAQLLGFCHGEDTRPLALWGPPKSLAAEITWGVRFEAQQFDLVNEFVSNLATEVLERMKKANVQGSHVTIKV